MIAGLAVVAMTTVALVVFFAAIGVREIAAPEAPSQWSVDMAPVPTEPPGLVGPAMAQSSQDPNFESLVRKAEQKGRIGVIVSVGSDPRRDNAAAAREKLIEELARVDGARAVYRVKGTPLLSTDLSAAGLHRLKACGCADEIDENVTLGVNG
ncbi:MAG: hypothetical protein WDO24_12735 [Pseudomonadota bacterium]